MQPSQFKPDEIHNNVRRLVTTGTKLRNEIPTFRTGPDQPARRAANHVMMNAVGGTSIHYYANSWRFHPWDFKARSESVKRYGTSSIPQGTTLEDWPLTYDDLEPYYDRIEYEIGVAGNAGNIQGKIDPAGNVFEGARQRNYPMPPLRRHRFHGLDAIRRQEAGLESTLRPRGDQLAAARGPFGLRLPRVLRYRRVPYRREKLDGDYNDPSGTKDPKPQDF